MIFIDKGGMYESSYGRIKFNRDILRNTNESRGQPLPATIAFVAARSSTKGPPKQYPDVNRTSQSQITVLNKIEYTNQLHCTSHSRLIRESEN